MSFKISLSEVNQAGLYHKMQLFQFRFGSPVVKGLEDGPCDGARHVKNAWLKLMHGTNEEILHATWTYEADSGAFGLHLVSPSYGHTDCVLLKGQ